MEVLKVLLPVLVVVHAFNPNSTWQVDLSEFKDSQTVTQRSPISKKKEKKNCHL